MKSTYTINDFYRTITVSIKKQLQDKIEIEYSIDNYQDLSKEDIDYIASIEITGNLNGDLFLFTSKNSLKFLFKTIFNTEYEDLEKDDLIQDSLNEFLNIIIANSAELFSYTHNPIEFGTPHKKNIDALLGLFKDFRSGVKIKTQNSSFILIFVSKNKV